MTSFGIAKLRPSFRPLSPQLSGREPQRAAIARAIVKRPQVLLCDEPTGALDFQTGKLILQALERVNRELGTTIVAIAHNVGIAAMAGRVITMGSGEIVAIESNKTKISPENLDWQAGYSFEFGL